MTRGVKYLTDNQQENEKLLSFKERILRDLEEANKQIVQVEKEYDLPVQEISSPENKKKRRKDHFLNLCQKSPKFRTSRNSRGSRSTRSYGNSRP